jgi:hypothetical protein
MSDNVDAVANHSSSGTAERLLNIVAAILAVFVFVTGIQSLKQCSRSPEQPEVMRSSAPTAPTTRGIDSAVAAQGDSFLGEWDGYLARWHQNLQDGKVIGWTQYYPKEPEEEIVVTAAGRNAYSVRHRYKDGSVDDTHIFIYRDGKLVRDGKWSDFYKGQIPTIWRAPDGTAKYVDGVSDLRLRRRGGEVKTSFVGLWFLKSRNMYFKISARDGNQFALSPGTGDQSGEYAQTHADGIEWQPPITLSLTDGELRGVPPNFPSGDLIIKLQGDVELSYTEDFGNGNRSTGIARRIMVSPDDASD